MTLSRPSKGESLASGSAVTTSSPAPPTWPASSAAISAGSSISGPRAGVHDVDAFLHLGEGGRIQHAARRRQQRRVHRDIVGRLEQRVEIDALDVRGLERFRFDEGVVGDDLHAEGLRLGRHQARDMAEADQAEHRALDAPDRHHRRHFPAAALHQFVGERNLADQRQQQRHGVVGDFADAVVRYVIDGDAFLLGGRQVDIVDAQTETADRLAFGELAEDVARELGIGHQNGVGVLARPPGCRRH